MRVLTYVALSACVVYFAGAIVAFFVVVTVR